MAAFLKWYLRVLAKHPYKTQSSTTGGLMAVGDIIAQFVVEKKSIDDYSATRTGRFLVFGTFALGPLLRTWYLVLDRIIVSPPSGLTTLKKVALDQMMFAPTVLPIFLGVMSYWRTYSIETAKEKIKQDYRAVLLTNYKIWPAAQLINFYFVPFQHRILYTNCIALYWNVYMAYKTEVKTQTELLPTEQQSMLE
ncbi:Protein Mpv17 [Lamellibrachia satsuma]|nr:Protein Mpv17 [Lamellibrachia satsuma]